MLLQDVAANVSKILPYGVLYLLFLVRCHAWHLVADQESKILTPHLTLPFILKTTVNIDFHVRTNKCVLWWRFGWMVVRWEESGTHSESVLEQESLSCHRSANRPKCGRGCTHLFSGAHPPTVLSTPDTCATKPDCTLTLFLYSGVSFWCSCGSTPVFK